MRHLMFLVIISLIGFSCETNKSKKDKLSHSVEIKTTEAYELHKVEGSEIVLILFPGGGATSKETKEEFKILPIATDQNISVLLMNFNRHLWIDKNQTENLSKELNTIFQENDLSTSQVYIGGMSIGGNVALTLSNFLYENKSAVVPKGVFMVDSPIDLYGLYQSSLKDINNPDLSEDRVAEPKWIVNYFEEKFGKESMLKNIQKISPFTRISQTINVPHLKDAKLRFYTEPDAAWHKKNRQTDFENTNAYAIQQIANQLKTTQNWKKFELIETEYKGFRSNGERHPHSWSIVEIDALIKWMKA